MLFREAVSPYLHPPFFVYLYGFSQNGLVTNIVFREAFFFTVWFASKPILSLPWMRLSNKFNVLPFSWLLFFFNDNFK